VESGQSILEFALVTPVVLLIFFGMIDLGRWMFLAMEVASSARAGIQYGAQNRATAADSAGIVTAAKNDVPDIPGITVTPTQYCQCSAAPGTNVSCSSLASCSGSSNRLILFLRVDTSAIYTPWISYSSIAVGNITIKGHAVMRPGQ